MAVAVLIYNIVLTSLLTLAMACAYYLCRSKKRKVFAAIGLMFGIYLIDNTIVFCTESIQDFASLYDKMFISSPSFKTIYYLALMGCIIYLFYTIMHPPTPLPLYGVMGAYAALLICAPLIPESNWKVFLYYLPTQLLLIGLCTWGLLAMKHKADWYCRPFYGTFRKILIFLLCVSVLIVLEDAVVIFAFDRYSQAGLKINNRSVTENLLFIGLACYFVKYTVVVLGNAEANLLGPLEPKTLEEKTPLHAFSLTYNLTEREYEILAQLLDGKGQQEISESLVIALGTVKTHIHNIYQKIDVSKKSQLFAKYQEFVSTLPAATQDSQVENEP